MVAQFGDGRHFKRGRQASASVGITPRHAGTGGKNYLFGITKKGNPYLRSILIHGARSVVSKAKRKDDRLSRWVTELAERKHLNVAAVAVEIKLCVLPGRCYATAPIMILSSRWPDRHSSLGR